MTRLSTVTQRVPILLVWFVILWEWLWGNFTVANLASGIVVCIGLVLLVRLPGADLRSYRGGRFHPIRALVFLLYFLVKVVQANLQLAWAVIVPRDHIRPGILAIELRDCSDALLTVIANAITLTPGSIIIEILDDPTTVYVHVLQLRQPEKVRGDLLKMAEMAVRAFGSPEALAQFQPDAGRAAASVASGPGASGPAPSEDASS